MSFYCRVTHTYLMSISNLIASDLHSLGTSKPHINLVWASVKLMLTGSVMFLRQQTHRDKLLSDRFFFLTDSPHWFIMCPFVHLFVEIRINSLLQATTQAGCNTTDQPRKPSCHTVPYLVVVAH